MKLVPKDFHSCPSSLQRFSVTKKKAAPTAEEKQISFEIKTDNYNRKVEIKTKQEEMICTTKNGMSTKSSPIVTRITKSEKPFSSQNSNGTLPRQSSSIC